MLAASAARRGPDAIELKDAGDWMRRALAQGPRPAAELTEAAANFGFHERTLRRALHAIGGEAQKRGFLEGWYWSLPNVARGPSPFAQSSEQKGTVPLSGSDLETATIGNNIEITSSPNSHSTCEIIH
jgi:hypothetical protein